MTALPEDALSSPASTRAERIKAAIKIQDNLRRLGELGFKTPTAQSFGRLMADRMGSAAILPEGFVVCAELLIYDLQTGVDGFTGQPMHSSLVGQPIMIYALLRATVGQIAEACCEPEFSEAVKKLIEEANHR